MNRLPVSLLLLLSLCSCSSQVAQPQPVAAPAPVAAAQQRYENKDAGIALMYPAGWTPVKGTKSQLKVEAPDKTKGMSQLTLDVPALPWHVPGMIPIGSVASGYIDDQKKQMPDQTVTNLPDPTLPDARQRRVKISGHLNGKSTTDEAVLIVHNDKVYILTADGDDAGYPAAHAALDAAVQSLQWTK